MPILYQMPDGAAGMLVLTFVDAAHEQFVDLAAWQFASEADLSDAWNSVPEAPADTALLLDRHTSDGCDASRPVTVEWIEGRCDKSIADLIAEGRQALAQWMADWKASRRPVSA